MRCASALASVCKLHRLQFFGRSLPGFRATLFLISLSCTFLYSIRVRVFGVVLLLAMVGSFDVGVERPLR